MEGKPDQMANNMALARNKWPGDTKMFPGHEYAVANLTFCKTVQPQNPVVLQWLEKF